MAKQKQARFQVASLYMQLMHYCSIGRKLFRCHQGYELLMEMNMLDKELGLILDTKSAWMEAWSCGHDQSGSVAFKGSNS